MKQSLPQGVWKPDPAHTRLGFRAKHMGVATVRGELSAYDAEMRISDDGEISISGEAETASVTTGVEDRDQHLRSEDFFFSERWPVMKFESTRVEEISDGEYEVSGDLTIRDVTRPVTLTAELGGVEVGMSGEDRIGLEISGEISRKEFGMRFDAALGSGNLVVSDAIKLELDVSAIRRDEQPAARETEELEAEPAAA